MYPWGVSSALARIQFRIANAAPVIAAQAAINEAIGPTICMNSERGMSMTSSDWLFLATVMSVVLSNLSTMFVK